MGGASKRHHYVPQAYLRGFATKEQRIMAVPLDRSRVPFTSAVKNVAVRTHFHTVEGIEDPDEFETVLSNIENDAMAVIRKMEMGEFPVSEKDRWGLSFYIALQEMRGPDARRTVEHLQAQVLRLEVGAGGRNNVKRLIKEKYGFEATDEEAEHFWNEATKPEGLPIRFSNLAHINHMVRTAIEITPYIACRPWTLVRFNRRSLIASDGPIGRIHDPDGDPLQGAGFATAWFISFPLTRKLGLFMSDPMEILKHADPDVQEFRAAVLRGEIDVVRSGTTMMERLFNQHTAYHASEYLYLHPDDEKFVPGELHEPILVKVAMEGFFNTEFDGMPWFGRGSARE